MNLIACGSYCLWILLLMSLHEVHIEDPHVAKSTVVTVIANAVGTSVKQAPIHHHYTVAEFREELTCEFLGASWFLGVFATSGYMWVLES